MPRSTLAVLRVGINTAILLGLFGQAIIIPTTAAHEVDQFPPYAPFAVPYVTVAIAGVACVQVVLIAAGVLLTMVRRDAIFTPRAFRWVDAIIGSSLVATLLALCVAGHLLMAEIPSRDGGMEVDSALAVAVIGVGLGTVFVMLVVVLRGLLRKATELQTEIAEVV